MDDTPTDQMLRVLQDLEVADPAEAPDLADAIAEQLGVALAEEGDGADETPA